MDFKARESAWQTQLNQVFDTEGEVDNSADSRSHRELCSQIKVLFNRRMRLWWNKAFMQRYVDRGLIPRGLRVQVFPSFNVTDETFKRDWEEAATDCSRSFMGLLINNNEASLRAIDEEISVLQDRTTKELTPAELSNFHETMNKEFVKWEKELVSNKTKKYQRDVTDYKNQQVYRWKGTTRRRRNFVGLPHSVSASSISSVEDESSTSQASSRPVTRGFSGKNRPEKTSPALGKSTLGAIPKKGNSNQLEVINLSQVQLTTDQIEVLKLGLTFVPDCNFDLFTVAKDLNLFLRKVVLHKIHARGPSLNPCTVEREEEAVRTLEELEGQASGELDNIFPTRLYPRSTTFPPFSLCPQVQVFHDLVMGDLRSLSKRTNNNNLAVKHQRALEELRKLEGVIIKPADKGGNVVVWPSAMYEREVYKQLRNTDFYQMLPSNPTNGFLTQLTLILENALASGTITKKMYDGLLPDMPVTPTFYLLPKIHKNPRVPPGRPIVSGIGGLCDAVCKFIDFYLQPLVETLPSHVRDTSDVLRRINGLTVERGILLATLDVETLYTNICHEHGLQAVEYFLGMSNWAPPLQHLILELLEFVLTHNAFTFGERFFLQRRGTAMGAACAPSYANLFLGYWEREVFGDGVPASSHVQCWLRFIDDIFVIWGGTALELEGFVRHLNSNSYNIYLTYQADPSRVDFLDIGISINDQGLLTTDIYRKPSSVNALLHASSGHPQSTINAIPTGFLLCTLGAYLSVSLTWWSVCIEHDLGRNTICSCPPYVILY
ncbi:uncharacterized protein ACNLHF_016745 [Anomaloglossus baeobatrachus]